MRLACSTLLIYCFAMPLCFVSNALAQNADLKGIRLARKPAPFYAEYSLDQWSEETKPPTESEIASARSRLRRTYIAKGYSEKAADWIVKQSEATLRVKLGGKIRMKLAFGAGAGASLSATQQLQIPVRTIVKSDRYLQWNKAKKEKGSSFPIIDVFPIDLKSPVQRTNLRQEAVIFGLAPIESLFLGFPRSSPQISHDPTGEVRIRYAVPEGDINAGFVVGLTLDKMGRITRITNIDCEKRRRNRWHEVWLISNYVKANEGWLPGVIDRQVHKGDKLLSTMHYELNQVETGQPVVDQWFSNHVNQPSFVFDSRFCNVTVKYFAKKDYLPDEEVKRRAEQIAMAQGGQSPVQKPNSPWRAAGVILVMAGCAGLVLWFGWPRKAAS